jgi:uracil-DNA glycosylase
VAKAVKHVKLGELASRIRVCRKCPLYQSRTLAVPGEGKPTAKVIVIGEAPGREEDESGRPFVGSAGRFLDQVLRETKLDRADLFITNIVKCRPPQNRRPKTIEVETCVTNYLHKQIELLNPKLIVLLGSVATKALIGAKTLEEARGRVIEHSGRLYLAGYHPAAKFYREDLGEKVKEDFAFLKRTLKKLLADKM